VENGMSDLRNAGGGGGNAAAEWQVAHFQRNYQQNNGNRQERKHWKRHI